MMSPLSKLPCDWCSRHDTCRFQWLDENTLPCAFCSLRCMENYIYWQVAQRTHARLEQNRTKTEQEQDNAKHRKVRSKQVSQG